MLSPGEKQWISGMSDAFESSPSRPKAHAPLYARDMARPAVVLGHETRCATIKETFLRNAWISHIVITDGGDPVGLLHRHKFLEMMAKPFFPELYDTKPVGLLLTGAVLGVDASLRADKIAETILSDYPQAFEDGFLVFEKGMLLGVGFAADTMKGTISIADRQRIDMQQALAEVAAASQAKSSFLANVSHELRTPLNAIIGFSDMLLHETENFTTGQQEFLGHIREGSGVLLELVNDLLDLTIAASGKLELTEGSFQLEDVTRQCYRLVSSQAAKKGVIVNVSAAPAKVFGDERKIKQACLNILSNAVKYTPPGGVVELTTTRTNNGDLSIDVTDTGIGIDEEEIAHILEPFVRSSNQEAQKQQGAGLGLALAKTFMEMHEGTIAIRSRRQVGTRVTMTLPAARVEGAELPTEAEEDTVAAL